MRALRATSREGKTNKQTNKHRKTHLEEQRVKAEKTELPLENIKEESGEKVESVC